VRDRREILAQAISDLIDCRLGKGHATQAVQQREVVNRPYSEPRRLSSAYAHRPRPRRAKDRPQR
jgi:hypothetical protein